MLSVMLSLTWLLLKYEQAQTAKSNIQRGVQRQQSRRICLLEKTPHL